MSKRTKKSNNFSMINVRKPTNSKRNDTIELEENNEVKFDSIKELQKKSYSERKYLPSFEIVNGPSFGSVKFNLQKGQRIISQLGCMAYMDGHMKVDTVSRGGFFSGLKRMLLTSSSMFLTCYMGTEKKNEICFSSQLPGDVLPIVIRPHEKIIISPFSLICFTNNLTINSKRRLRGIFTNEGIYQTELVNKTNKDGLLFLSAYGGHQKVKIPEGKTMKLDNGLFLCSHTQTKYGITVAGGVKSGLLSGEGLMMEFTGPCELYIQGRSIHSLLYFIKRHSTFRRE